MKNKTDTLFSLTYLFEKKEQTKSNYEFAKSQIDTQGYCTIINDTITVKIYTPQLFVILTSPELLARNIGTQKDTKINGFEYLTTYTKAFNDGIEYFNTKHYASPNTIYGENTKQYVRDLHLNYFHIEHIGKSKGWSSVKRLQLATLSHKQVKELGFYSGIVSVVDAMIKEYPKGFESFYRCENTLSNQKNKTNITPDTNETKLSEKIREHFSFMLKNDPRKHEQILLKNDFEKLIEWVTFFFDNNFKLPEISQPLKRISTAKGNVIYTFILLFDAIHASSTRPDSLFELIKKCFFQYRNDKISNLKKSTKKPKGYDSLLKS